MSGQCMYELGLLTLLKKVDEKRLLSHLRVYCDVHGGSDPWPLCEWKGPEDFLFKSGGMRSVAALGAGRSQVDMYGLVLCR